MKFGSVCGVVVLLLGTSAPAVALLPPTQTGDLYVTNFSGNNIAVYDSAGVYQRTLLPAGLTQPRGIAFAPDGRFFVASQQGNQVFVFDENEVHTGAFAPTAPDPALNGPTGLAISNDGSLLYVSSFNNDSVFVFDLDGNYLRDFGHADLNGPNCVAFDSTGNFYISSALNANVLKFDANEQHIVTFTSLGAISPMSIARNTSDELYVSGGGSSNIVKFDTNGNVLDVITHPDLPATQGIAFDDAGHFFSSSFSQPNILEFDENDDYVRTITDPTNLSVPRSLAFARVKPAPVPTASQWALTAMSLALLTAGTIILRRRPAARSI